MIQAKEALEIAHRYQTIQEYVTKIEKSIQAAAAEGKTSCWYMLKTNINIGDGSYCSCDIIANYLRDNGYKVMFHSTFAIDMVELDISWAGEEEEEEPNADNS